MLTVIYYFITAQSKVQVTKKIIPTFCKWINTLRGNNHSTSFLPIFIFPISYSRSSSIRKRIIILLFSIN